MSKAYIFEAENNTTYQNSQRAVLLLPDIFGQSDYSKATVNELAQVLATPVFMLDYFSQITDKPTNISTDNPNAAMSLMQKMTGDNFVKFFQKALVALHTDYPHLTSFVVIGFCFGGRLAYLSGLEPSVEKIVSFYGGGAHTPDYYRTQTPIEALTVARKNDKALTVLSFYGLQDNSIPAQDRSQTKKLFAAAGIAYSSVELDAGHAYFQPGRDNYDEAAATLSLQKLKDFMVQ